jgi:septum formation protein
LKCIFDEFEIRVSGAKEQTGYLDPVLRVLANAFQKARAVEREKCDLVITADTVVDLDGRILEKPRDERDAFDMLSALSGRTHRVCTGVVMEKDGVFGSFCEQSLVTFRPLTDELIRAYIATGEPMDKAGAYGIQGPGAFLVSGVNGDYYNVMGLPVCRLRIELEKRGWIR